MKLLPYDRFVLISEKSPDETAAALAPFVREPKWFRMSMGFLGKKPETPYTGTVTSQGFKIWPAIRYRNSFLPIIVGAIEPDVAGVKIKITQRLHVAAMVFLVFWLTVFFGITSFINAQEIPAEDSLPFNPGLFPVVMLGFVWLITSGGFWWEARHSREKLSNILAARIDDGF